MLLFVVVSCLCSLRMCLPMALQPLSKQTNQRFYKTKSPLPQTIRYFQSPWVKPVSFYTYLCPHMPPASCMVMFLSRAVSCWTEPGGGGRASLAGRQKKKYRAMGGCSAQLYGPALIFCRRASVKFFFRILFDTKGFSLSTTSSHSAKVVA